MKPRYRELLERAIAAMVAAIDVYNKPDFLYRAESFTILALNAWELLIKAKWLVNNNNRLSSLFVPDGKTRGKRFLKYKRSRSGNPLTHNLNYLAKRLTEQGILHNDAHRNLEVLIELRDTFVHFYHRRPEIAQKVQEVGMACLKNFVSAVQDWFGEDLSRFNFYLMPLSFIPPPNYISGIHLNKNEKNFIQFLERLRPEDEDPASRYSVTVNIEVRFVRSKGINAIPVQLSTDQDAVPVNLTEEQIRERYPWDYKELTQRCRERYANFKADVSYHRLRKSLEANNNYAHIRLLDPSKQNSLKKIFYSPIIMREFDIHYTRK